MKTKRILARTALALAAAASPLAAQTPLFADGTAFGGSRVFSEGLNPLGNPARFDQAAPGWYLTFLDGDQRAKDNKTILQDTLSTDAAAAGAALARLKDAPWALRVRAYGLTGVKDGMNFGYTREEFHSGLASVDLDHLGASLADNASALDGRRAVVNRLHYGAGTLASGTAAGFNIRVEKWEMGTVTAPLNRNPDVFPAPMGTFPFPYAAGDYVLAYSATRVKTLSTALDVGFTTQIAEGLHVGVMVDQINAKRLWDVDLKPQYRGALQIDLGPNTRFTAEGDFNAVMRMPFPVKQKTLAGSLRYQVSPSVIVLLGGEQKKIGESAVTRFGATLHLRTPSFLLALGFQAGQDRPLKGLSLMVN